MNTSVHTSDAMARRVAKRRAAESRFRAYGIVAIALAIAALAALFISIIGNGYTAFQQTFIELEVTYDPAVLGIGDERDSKTLSAENYPGLVKKTMRDMFPDVKSRKDKRAPVRHRKLGRRLHASRTRDRRSRNHRPDPARVGAGPTATSTCSSRATVAGVSVRSLSGSTSVREPTKQPNRVRGDAIWSGQS